MKRKYYIAYGSNLCVDQMLHRCPDAIVIGSATIKDYKLTFRGNSRSGVANIEPSKGDSVQVGIWAVSQADEMHLDIYEGYPHLYTKQFFNIKIRGRVVEAMAYVMTPGHRIEAPSRYYLGVIHEGYLDFGFDTLPLLDAAARARKGA